MNGIKFLTIQGNEIMNKFCPIIFIIVCFCHLGCSRPCEFDLKEKCSRYVEKAKQQKGENNYFGTFFSRTNETCISIYWGNNTFFKDELSGIVIETTTGIPDYQKVAKSLDLVGWTPTLIVPQI